MRFPVAPNAAAVVAPQTVAQVLLNYLKLEGVDRVFGIPGAAIGNLLVALKNERDQFPFIVCRHESGAAFMADGYHRSTGNLGVVIVTSGPGATNALTGTVNANSDGSSMLTITGEVARQFFGRGYLQEGIDADLDIERVYAAATALSDVIGDPSEFQTLFEQALRDARSVPGHAVHLSIPNDVPALAIPNTFAMPASTSCYRSVPNAVHDGDVRETLRLLQHKERPLVFLGNGCRDALRDPDTLWALTNFVERHAIPVVTTGDAKGIFPETHELSLRNYGFGSCRWPAQWMLPEGGSRFDGLLAVGSALRGLATESWNPRMVPDGPFIQLDLNQQAIGRALHVTLGIVGEAGAFLRRLTELAGEFPHDPATISHRRKLVGEIKRSSPFLNHAEYNSNTSPIEPAALVRVLEKTLPRNSIIFLDAGNAVAWGVNYFVIDPPMEIHSSLAMGPMGFAVAGVIGAKMGRPDCPCIGFVGDGAFLMHGAELSTAQAHGVGAIWIVLQDDDLHMVSQGMDYFYPDSQDPHVWDGLFRLGKPDLELFARGLGADTFVIDSPAELERVIPSALAGAGKNKPQVIIAKINHQAYSPFFPPPRPPNTGHGVP